MLNYKKTFISWLLTMALIVSPLSAVAEKNNTDELGRPKMPPNPGAMIADLVMVRPLSLVGTIGGSAVFIVSLPFSLLGGNSDAAWESLVVTPASYTFTRPLGEFDE